MGARTLTVHLVRHGETESYDHDVGLTGLGRAQAGERGTALADELHDGDQVAFCHPPTLRARETCELVRRAVVDRVRARGIVVTDTGTVVEPGYRNVQVWADGTPREPTQVRRRATELLAGTSLPPGWAVEADRFWRAHDETGDAMRFWLTTPLLWHEPPASVVRRMLDTSAARLAAGLTGHVVVGTHSGCLRALVWWAAGADPGEPDNGAEVVVRLTAGSDLVSVGYGGQEWRCRAPNGPPDWSVARDQWAGS